MTIHECGCQTRWHDELNHPVYEKACFGHRPFAHNWLLPEMPTVPLYPRESVSQ